MIDATSFPQNSLFLLLGGDAILRASVDDWLGRAGWTGATIDHQDDLVGTPVPALALLDGRRIDAPAEAARWIAAVRALPGVAAGTPVMLVADAHAPSCAGIAGRIDLPLDPATARPVVEQWCGPIADHGFRDAANPHYRLVRLAGRVQADALMRGFADHLANTIADAERGEPLGPAAHRIAGLAGLVGFGELTPLWSALDRDESADPAAALAASRTVLDTIRQGFPKP